MRGYEGEEVNLIIPSVLSYESPCGVMSRKSLLKKFHSGSLRIPMRGYELSGRTGREGQKLVTNPHAGL